MNVFRIRLALVAFALVSLAGCRWFGRSQQAAGGPVLLISIDTLRADHLPVYGYAGVRTPAIDALAKTSTVFEHAYTHAPQTLPAHTAILTGELPFQTGVRDNVGFTLKDGQWTLARALHDDGYATGGFVSAYVLRSATRINQGFDTYDDDLPAASSERSLGQVQRDGALTLAAAEKWFDARTSDRVFMFVHFYEPHKPVRAARALLAIRAVRRRDRATPTSSSAACSTSSARRTSSTRRRSSCSPITARGSAITASRNTACSSIRRRRTSP